MARGETSVKLVHQPVGDERHTHMRQVGRENMHSMGQLRQRHVLPVSQVEGRYRNNSNRAVAIACEGYRDRLLDGARDGRKRWRVSRKF